MAAFTCNLRQKLLTRPMKKLSHYLLPLLLSFIAPAFAADPFVGQFSGALDGREYRITIDQFSAGAYDGLLQVDGEPMQLDARRYGEYITGLLQSEREKFGFRARLQGSILIVETEDGRRIVMQRQRAE